MAITFKITDGDMGMNPATGRPTTITERAKVDQDLKEFFGVEVLPNGFGAGIEQLVGIVESSPEIFVSMVDRQIRDGLRTFSNLIFAESRIPRSPIERIIGYSNFQVAVDTEDPTLYWFSINILTENGQSSQFTAPIQVA